MRIICVVLLGLVLVGCGGDNSAGTAPSATTNYQGQWTGDYSIAACQGSGAFGSGLCSTFTAGSVHPMQLTLTQTAEQANGTLVLGNVSFPVSGMIGSSGQLLLNGTSTVLQGGVVVQVSLNGWNTSRAGATMNGGFNTTWTSDGGLGVGQLQHAIHVLTRTA